MAIEQIQPTGQTERIQLEPRLFTLDEYERMIEVGIFREDEHLELIRGEIIVMTPIGIRHAACVTRLTTLLVRKVGDSAIVWTQNPFVIPNHSRPEPDLALLRWRDDYYAAKLPTSVDILLVIEVADTTLKDDRNGKGPLYAEAGIPEYWIVNLQDKVVEVYSDPAGGTYTQISQFRLGQTPTLPAGLEGSVDVSDILGQ